MSADELIQQGKTAIDNKQVDKAVEFFQSACEKLSKEHGDLHESLAYPNFLYGCALLELAKMESDVIGLSLKGVLPKDGDDKDEDNSIIDKSENPLSKTELEDIAEQVIDAMCEDKTESSESKDSSEKDENKESDTKDVPEANETVEKLDEKKNDEENKPEDNKEDEVKEGDEDQGEDGDEGQDAEGEDEEGDDEEEEEDVSNLQLAWEVFEVSRNIYSKQEGKEAKLMTANCLMKLAEVSREKDEFDPSIADFNSALEIRRELCEAHSRSIAEVHFELAVTYMTKEDLNQATASFNECVQVLKSHVDHLKNQLETSSDDEKKKIQEEIDQVTELIKDVEQRSKDAEEEIKTGNKPSISQDKPGFVSKSDGPASDISHLVKKKRTVDDESKENDENALKKQKVDGEEQNGDCKKVDASVESANQVPVNGH